MSEEMSKEAKQTKAMSYEMQKFWHEQLVKKYEVAERNLNNNPEKCGGADHIRGYMSGLLEGMVILNPDLTSQCMGVEE